MKNAPVELTRGNLRSISRKNDPDQLFEILFKNAHYNLVKVATMQITDPVLMVELCCAIPTKYVPYAPVHTSLWDEGILS